MRRICLLFVMTFALGMPELARAEEDTVKPPASIAPVLTVLAVSANLRMYPNRENTLVPTLEVLISVQGTGNPDADFPMTGSYQGQRIILFLRYTRRGKPQLIYTLGSSAMFGIRIPQDQGMFDVKFEIALSDIPVEIQHTVDGYKREYDVDIVVLGPLKNMDAQKAAKAGPGDFNNEEIVATVEARSAQSIPAEVRTNPIIRVFGNGKGEDESGNPLLEIVNNLPK